MNKRFIKISCSMVLCVLVLFSGLVGAYKIWGDDLDLNSVNLFEIKDVRFENNIVKVNIMNTSSYPVILGEVKLNIPNTLDTRIEKHAVFKDENVVDGYSGELMMDGLEYSMMYRVNPGDDRNIEFPISDKFDKYVMKDEGFGLSLEYNVFKVKSGEGYRFNKGKYLREFEFELGGQNE